jgi:TfoX/Sxy family transcriptional regulator of competence genes
MAYDEALAERVRALLNSHPALSERKMFGGLAFMLHGNMACGLTPNQQMVRVGPDAYEEALAQPHARPMDFTGRPMKGMVFVDPPGYATDEGLATWVKRGAAYAASLPPK